MDGSFEFGDDLSGPGRELGNTPDDRSSGAGRRIRIRAVDVSHEPGSRVRVEVTLALGDRSADGEASGVGGEMVQLRLAAAATLAAVEDLLQRPKFLKLVGVKHIHAFDADLVLVGLRTFDEPTRQLLGGVPIEKEAIRAATAATLDAINRVLGHHLEED